MGRMADRGTLLASIHDVSPRFESEVDGLVDLLRTHVGNRIAMLVIPNHWGDAPIVPNSDFAARLRSWANDGFEIFLHGFYHRDASRHARGSDQLRARLMTAGEGEFLGLPVDEATTRLMDGTRLLEDIIGRPLAGFVAPAWLYGPRADRRRSSARLVSGNRETAGPRTCDYLGQPFAGATGVLLGRRFRIASSADPSTAGRGTSARYSPSCARPKHKKDAGDR